MPAYRFKPSDHPRDLRGRFRSVVAALDPGEEVKLPDGLSVFRLPIEAESPGRRFAVRKDGRTIHHAESVPEAAGTALEESATTDHPKSIGGKTAFPSLRHATETKAERRVREAEEDLGRAHNTTGSMEDIAEAEHELADAYRQLAEEQERELARKAIAEGVLVAPRGEGPIPLRSMDWVAFEQSDFDAEAYAVALHLAREKRRGFIRKGKKGPAVLNLQHVLSLLGHDTEADGDFGPKTMKALKDYQEEHGLDVDGVVGPQTLRSFKHAKPKDRGMLGVDAMEYEVNPDARGIKKSATAGTDRLARSRARKSQSKTKEAKKGPHGGTIGSSGREIASSTTGPIGTTDPRKDKLDPLGPGAESDFNKAHPRQGAGSPTGGQFIAKGSTGAQVVAAQKALNENGGDLKVDGKFGPRTEAETKAFQRRHDLKVDGVIGPVTREILRPKKKGQAKLVMSAQEAVKRGIDLAVLFDPQKHPRDWKGRWRNVLKKSLGDGASKKKAKAHRRVIDEAFARATDVAQNSRDHGPKHWRDVAHMGMVQIKAGVPADPDVLLLFGALHDTQRFDEWTDPEHGPRAAAMADDLRQDGFLDHLSEEQFAQLRTAMVEHNGSPGSDDTTIGAALDADRYTLWRVGIEPDFRFMSGGRNGHLSEMEMLELKAYGRERVVGADLTWDDLLEQWALVS